MLGPGPHRLVLAGPSRISGLRRQAIKMIQSREPTRLAGDDFWHTYNSERAKTQKPCSRDSRPPCSAPAYSESCATGGSSDPRASRRVSTSSAASGASGGGAGGRDEPHARPVLDRRRYTDWNAQPYAPDKHPVKRLACYSHTSSASPICTTSPGPAPAASSASTMPARSNRW